MHTAVRQWGTTGIALAAANVDNNSRSTSGWVLVSRSATSCGQSISWAVVIACFLCSSDFDGSVEESRDDHLQSGYDTPDLISGPTRTPLCWTQPAACPPTPTHRATPTAPKAVSRPTTTVVIYRSEHDGRDPFLPKGSRPSSRQTTTSSATATPRLFQVEVANARATHADTPRSVGGRFADRVTPCPTPIGSGACLTTTRQASRYGDRPRPTRQPRTREWREACETL